MDYETKFAGLLRAIAHARSKNAALIVATPMALGDTYDELVESLYRIADAEIELRIVPREGRV